MELHRNDYWTLAWEEAPAFIRLTWLPGTANMTANDFKAALILLAHYAEEYRSSGLWVDVARFKHEMAPEVGAWRQAHIIPRYNAAGVRKFVYSVGGAFPLPPKQDKPDHEDFVTRFVDSEDEARDWLAAG